MGIPRNWRVAAAAGIVPVALLLGACQAGPGGSAAAAQPAASSKLMVNADIVWGSKNLTGDAAAQESCVLNSRFPRNSEIVWRTRVYDPRTGQPMDQSSLSKVVVQLGDGQSFPMKFGDHPAGKPTDHFWATSWLIPKNYPTGSLDYKIVATSTDGRTGEFQVFNVMPSLLTITNDVIPDAKS